MTIKEIIKDYLDENGYDGLYDQDAECSCKKDDLFPCGDPVIECTAGYKGPCDCEEEHDYHIGPRRNDDE